jgi:hypothetical protein
MSACAGYGEKEEGRSISDFDLYRIASQKWQDMDLRTRRLFGDRLALAPRPWSIGQSGIAFG